MNTVSPIKFDISRLQGIIADSKAKSGGGDREQYTNVGFLPNGTHKVRIFIDPDGNIFREMRFFQFDGKKTLCPDQLNRENEKNPAWEKLPPCEITPIAKEINSWRSKLDLKFRVLIYMAVYESTAQDDKFWKADKQKGVPYAVVAKNKLKTAILSMLETLAADSPEYITQMLNPSLGGGLISITVTGGTQGSIQITPIVGASKPPIFEGEPPKWWKPLKEVFIPEGVFNKNAYDEALKIAQDKLKEHREKIAKGEKTDAQKDAEEEAAKNGGAPASAVSTAQTQPSPAVTPDPTPAPAPAPTPEPAPAPVVVAETPPAPVTPAPVETTVSPVAVAASQTSNVVKMKMGREITLPPEVMTAQCWRAYDASQHKCMMCPINIECMTEQSAA